MRKQKGKREKNQKRQRRTDDGKVKFRVLDEYDTRNYLRDIEYLARLSFLEESTRSWIEARMYELRDCSNRYEQFVGQLLMKKGVDFIHQAPFVFRPKTIYFADFYLPESRIVIEVDGIYHNDPNMIAKDYVRDANFKSVGIWVIRVSNEETRDTKRLWLRISEVINKRLKI